MKRFPILLAMLSTVLLSGCTAMDRFAEGVGIGLGTALTHEAFVVHYDPVTNTTTAGLVKKGDSDFVPIPPETKP